MFYLYSGIRFENDEEEQEFFKLLRRRVQGNIRKAEVVRHGLDAWVRAQFEVSSNCFVLKDFYDMIPFF